jgi:hypothetical protein
MPEQNKAEQKPEKLPPTDNAPQIVGQIAMPPEVKQTYAHIKRGSNQLVLESERFAQGFDVIPIPINY